MRFKVMPRWFKQTIAIAGLVLALPGFFIGLGLFCLTLILIINSDSGAIYAGLIGFTLILLTAGTGGTTFWHSIASLNGKVSKSLRLPPLWGLMGIFVLCFATGLIIYQGDIVTGLFLPPILLVAIAAPPLMAVIWFTGYQLGSTWRRGIIAFAGAATLSLIIFIMLQFIILVTISMLNSNPAEAIIDTVGLVFEGFFERNGISRMLNQRFAYIFVQLTIIIPLIGVLAKPLVTLPLVGQLSRRETFLLGAIAGAGFALVENMLYVAYELRVWPWILLVQALGSAIHPLGSGLAALGLREIVRGKSNAWSNWLAYFGIATALHSLWSLGFLLVIFGNRLFLLGGFAFTTFRLGGLFIVALIGLGVGALLAGRSIGQRLGKASDTMDNELAANRLPLVYRGIAIWAFVSLIALLPIGIIGLQSLLR